MDGSAHLQCNPDGSCKCKDHVSGDKCDQIQDGYYDLADPKGSLNLRVSITMNSCNFIFSKELFSLFVQYLITSMIFWN